MENRNVCCGFFIYFWGKRINMEIKLNASKIRWNIKPKELIKNFFDFNWGSALTDVVEIEKDEEAIAFLLLFTTTRKTIYELLKKYGQEKLNQTKNLVSNNKLLEIELKSLFENEVVITKDFFYNVIQYNPKYLTESFKIFKKFVNELDIFIPSDIHYEYYELFRGTLNNEFQEKKDKYSLLVQFFNNPIYEESLKQTYLFEHYKSIAAFYTSKLQSEVETSFETLEDLYIEPNFAVFKKNLNRPIPESLSFDSISEENTHKFIIDFFLKSVKHPDLKSNYNMLFLLGQPGQGKTSFCYKLVYDYIVYSFGLPDTPIFFIKIRDLVAKDFIENPFEVLYKKFHSNFNFEKENGILILDGLDEAYMGGGISDSDLRNLYDRLNKGADGNLKIILTSRKNYINLNDSCIDNSLVIELKDFTDNQIITYKQKFLHYYPKNKFIKKIDVFLSEEKRSKYKHIQELIRQPVIIYFIALANIDVERLNSKAEIYDKIFSSLSQRSWDKQKGQLDFINKNLDKKKYQYLLRDFIRHIAFEIYQSPKLYITLNKLSSLDATKIFVKKCFEESFVADEENFKKVTKYLLISFYFQEANNSLSETAIEFFHNSLWEFLTAEYIWEKFKDLFLAKDRFDEFITVDVKEYFDFVDKIIGSKVLSNQVQLNLSDIILNEDFSVLESIKKQVGKIFHKLSDNDFLLYYNYENSTLSSNLKASEIFELSFTIQNTIDKGLRQVTELSENFLKFFMIRNYRFHQIGGELENIKSSSRIPVPNGLGISFKNSWIGGMWNQELSDCNFSNMVFFEDQIRNCVFDECNFSDIIFININFIKSFFKKNHFFNSTFQNVTFDSIESYENFRNDNFFSYNFEEIHSVKMMKNKTYTVTMKKFSFSKIEKNFNDILRRSDVLLDRDRIRY